MSDQATREAAADLIERGIDVLHERGWCQNRLEDEQGRVCVVQALCEAEDDRSRARVGTFVLATDAIDREVGGELGEMVRFNNDPSTTVEDVVLTMKRAAHSLREVA